MAAARDEVLGACTYPACAPYSLPFPCPPAKGAEGPAPASPFPGRGQLAAAQGFDGSRRAQLLALLSRAGPGFGPLPRRPGCRDVGVQVNPRRDASVQCALGRQTLPRGAPAAPERGSPPAGAPRPARSPRSLAVYSPVASRGPAAFPEDAPERAAGPAGKAPPGGREDAARPPSREARADEAAPQPAPRSPERPPAGDGAAGGGDGGDAAPAKEESPPSTEPGKERLRFQFLEQKYGYYHCKGCNIRWESAYVWCVQGTSKVYFKQFCRTCQKSYNPYRVEDIACQSCKRTRCACSVRLRHVDPKRPHRQDLCGRCRGKRLSCDSTFSFKYII